ncbi:MAG: hypothetical protein R2844_10860 [Caldilineales bacterium]
MTKGKIAVTPRSLSCHGHPALDSLTQAGYEVYLSHTRRAAMPDDLRQFLPECVGYLAGVEPIPGEILAVCRRLKVISRNGVGVDNVDLVAARRLGIAVRKKQPAPTAAGGELAITLMLAGLRSAVVRSADQRGRLGAA